MLLDGLCEDGLLLNVAVAEHQTDTLDGLLLGLLFLSVNQERKHQVSGFLGRHVGANLPLAGSFGVKQELESHQTILAGVVGGVRREQLRLDHVENLGVLVLNHSNV